MKPKLFNTYLGDDDLRNYLPVNINTSFETLSPYLGLAEQNFIIPLLGEKLYNKLVDCVAVDDIDISDITDSGSGSASGSGASETTLMDNLLMEVKFAEMHLAYWKGYPVLSINFSDAGASTKASEGQRLFRYQEQKAEQYFKEEGFNKIDTVLSFLYANIEKFDDFKESEFYKEVEDSFIKNTKTFNSIYHINNSRLVFLKMQYFTKRVEDIDLHSILGEEFIKELLKAQETDEKYKYILKNVRSYVVYMSIAYGIRELKKQPTEKGLIFETQSADGFQEQQVMTEELKQTIDYSRETALRYMEAAINHIKKHKADYPAFFEHAGEDPATELNYRRDNTNKKTFWL